MCPSVYKLFSKTRYLPPKLKSLPRPITVAKMEHTNPSETPLFSSQKNLTTGAYSSVSHAQAQDLKPSIIEPLDFENPYKFYYQNDVDRYLEYSKRGTSKFKPFSGIKRLVIVDFDNTLFCSPLPNTDLWDSKCLGRLKNDLGWFMEPKILQPPYLSDIGSRWISSMEAKSREEINRSDTLTVLLTGRSDYIFHEIIRNLLKSRGLDFDLVILKENSKIRWDPYDNIINHRSINSSQPLENVIFALMDTNPTTFEYKMDVIDFILSKFSFIDSVFVWDDRQNHRVRMEEHLVKFHLKTNRVKEVGVNLVPQKTIHINPVLESELVNHLVLEYNHNLDLRYETDSLLHQDPVKNSMYNNTCLTQALANLSRNKSLHSYKWEKVKLEPIVMHTTVSIYPLESFKMEELVSVPKSWRKANSYYTLGKGLLDPKTLASRFYDFNSKYSSFTEPAVSLEDGKLVHKPYPEHLISYGDKVKVSVDGIGFIEGKIYGLRISSIRVFPGSRNSSSTDRKIYPSTRYFSIRNTHSLGLLNGDFSQFKTNKDSEYSSSNTGYNAYIPLSYNESEGARSYLSSKIDKVVEFRHMTKKLLSQVDEYFGTELSQIINLSALETLRKGGGNIVFDAKIEPLIRKTIMFESEIPGIENKQPPAIKKEAVSIGNMIKEVWGDSFRGRDVGFAKQVVIQNMEKSSVENKEENRPKILEFVKLLGA
ncbi:hypothetical protein BB560_005342 [Smittium megazygosporum]|uniref:Swiss Army Knife RNA repair protein HAD domain-containing protein n=1 Tax=Smittium megazygosporum TaxID=133381 RepID=A0A2T9Z6V1_9FUNG|nr:hypothetical protein BB560_005342 [Smittium megazygosporum]